MPKATTETAKKMLELVDMSTDQGKLTWSMITFLHQTRARFTEISSLTIGDVYHHGHAKKAVVLGAGPRKRTQLLSCQARQLIESLVLLQLKRGPISAESPLFRFPHSGRAWKAEEMSVTFCLYQEAAESSQ